MRLVDLVVCCEGMRLGVVLGSFLGCCGLRLSGALLELKCGVVEMICGKGEQFTLWVLIRKAEQKRDM